MTSVKVMAESSVLNSIPSKYAYSKNRSEPSTTVSDPEDPIPVIDFALLTSGTPHQRSKVIRDLGKACEEWGFFMVVNHGVPETLIKKVMDASIEFFNLTEEEKREFEGKHPLDPIRCGTGFHNARKEAVMFWRDYLKAIVHPEFNFPNKPFGFSEISLEYCKRTRKVATELVKGISESLGLEESYMDKALNLDSSFQLFAVNNYPPCPQPELAIGIPPHSDYALLTLLMQNGVGGLQVQHNGKWVNIDALPNSLLVNSADQLEIFSNGKYKTCMHRAVVNNRATRISVVTTHGPSLDTIVGPASKLVDSESHPPAFIPMKFKDYTEMMLNTPVDGKLCLDRVRVQGGQ